MHTLRSRGPAAAHPTTGSWRTTAVLAVAAIAWVGCGLAGCGEDPPGSPPSLTASPTTSGTPGTGTATDTDTAGVTGPVGGTSPIPPTVDHCAVGGPPPATSTTTGSDDGGFKFDVGSPDGGTFLPLSCDEASDRRTNLGCEFYAVDLPNDPRGTFMSPGAADQQFAVAVGNPSALQPATVEVFLPGEEAPFTAATIEPKAAHTFELPPLSIEAEFSTANGEAYRITSDVPVAAYQFNPLDNTLEVYSNDASLLFPVHALGTEYTAVTGDAVLLGMGDGDPEPTNAGAFVSVVAAQDNTTVTIIETAELLGELPRTLSLAQGQVMTVISSVMGGDGNLSGTAVTADAPVAVFSGNVATAEPLMSDACCADHMEHQLPPHTAWGSRYAVAPPPSSSKSISNDEAYYRITGLFDGTEFVYCPERPADAPLGIAAGQTLEFASDAPFSIASVDPDHSFAVTQFLQSNEVIGDDDLGDPAMLVVPAAVQLEKRVVFVVPAGYVVNRITVVAQDDGDVYLDGEKIRDRHWIELAVLDGVEYRYAQLDVGEGQHFLDGETRVGVSVFGYDEAVSYAYPGGAGQRIISVPPAAG